MGVASVLAPNLASETDVKRHMVLGTADETSWWFEIANRREELAEHAMGELT